MNPRTKRESAERRKNEKSRSKYVETLLPPLMITTIWKKKRSHNSFNLHNLRDLLSMMMGLRLSLRNQVAEVGNEVLIKVIIFSID